MHRPRVSVIMRCKNDEAVIGQALAALFSQTWRDFELIVADSGSTDRTLEIVRAFPCQVLHIPAAEYFPAKVLNRAAALARGEFLVFQNSDVVPLGPDALGQLLEPLLEGRAQASFARQLARPEAHTWVRRDYERAFPAQGPAPEWMAYSLPFAAMSRAAFEALPFSDATWGSEDTAWGVAARARGLRVAYAAGARVMHSHNYTLRQLRGRRFIEGEADAFIYGGHSSVAQLLRHLITSIARDALLHVRHRDLRGLLATPGRRAVFHAAHFEGHRWGEARLRAASADAGLAQRLVLGSR